MRRVVLDALIKDVPAELVYESISQFDRYADYAPHVQSSIVHQGRPGQVGRSSWELHFRSGLLSWTERENFVAEELLIEFHQLTGDFDEFAGRWSLARAGSDTELHFEVDFDFGIPSLEGILDPIAERVIKETVAWSVVGMFDVVVLGGDLDLTPTAAQAPTH